MTLKELEHDLELCKKEFKKNKNKKMVDFIECMIELLQTNEINNHQYVYARLVGISNDPLKDEVYATIEIYPRNKRRSSL